jgi:hypothetical protein
LIRRQETVPLSGKYISTSKNSKSSDTKRIETWRAARWPRKLKDRLASFASEVRKKASLLPHGPERDDMLKKASRQAETASHLDEWVNSPGLRPPK